MIIIDKINEIMGVNPPNFRRRLAIGISSSLIVLASLIALMIGTKLAFGFNKMLNSFANIFFGQSTKKVVYDEMRFLTFFVLMIFAYVLSLVYYVLLPWSAHKIEKEEYLEKGLSYKY